MDYRAKSGQQPPPHADPNEISGDEEYWSENLSTGSEYSCSSNQEWSPFITEDCSLFYIKCNPILTHKPVTAGITDEGSGLYFRNEYKRMSLRSDKRKDNILSKLRKGKFNEDKKYFNVKIVNHAVFENPDYISKDFTLDIVPSKKIGNIISYAENMLGLIVAPFPDARRLMVNQIKDNSIFAKDSIIKAGDWIKSIDDKLVFRENFEEVLSEITSPVSAKIQFQELLIDEWAEAKEINIYNLTEVIENLPKLCFPENLIRISSEIVFTMIFMAKSDSQSDDMDVLYCYPNRDKNILYNAKGSFVTINSITDSTAFGASLRTTVSYRNVTYHVTYSSISDHLLLLGFNGKYCNMFDVKQKTENLLNFLHLLSNNVGQLFNNTKSVNELDQICNFVKHEMINRNQELTVFERNFDAAHFTPLPKEIQLRIDDALSELEAMDFRSWNENLVQYFQEFDVIGCGLFLRTSVIASHFSAQDLLDVDLFMKNFGVHNVMETMHIKSLVIWRQIYLKSNAGKTKTNAHFIMLVSQGQLLLSVLLQQRIRTPENQKNPKTCLSYYAEEVQDILAHLRNTGVENLARIWLSSTKRPQILAEEHKTTNLTPEALAAKLLGKDTESTPGDEDDDDSDWDDQQSSQQSSTGFDMSELSENMCREFSDIIPSNLTTGPRNLLYFYVELEVGEGIFLAPVLNGYCDSIIDTFRKTCVLIHRTLQNTKQFREMLANEGSKKPLSRSLVAVKEQGVLISAKMKSEEIVEFWVVGRLFTNPTRELYVCHKIDAPQNMVEMAFKLCMSCAG